MKYKLALISIAISAIIVALHAQVPILSQYCGTGSNAVVNNFAPWYCTTSDPIILKEWSQYLPIMMLAVTLSYTIAAALFMFGIALKNDRLRTFGMGEIYEATASAFIVLMFGFIAAVMFGLLPSITAGAINPYDASLSYIALTTNTTYSAASGIFYTASVDDAYVSMNIIGSFLGQEIPNVLPVFTLPFFYLFFWPAFSIIGFMFEALISLYTQFYLIVFFMYAAIPVLLIPGVIFRAIIPTRNLGGMMMAAAIGFYFIMPTLFSVAYYFTSTSIQASLSQTEGIVSAYGANQNSIPQASSPTSPLVETLSQAKSALSSYWLSILFFPALILTITYMMITQIAEILGGMGRTSSRLRSLV